MSKELASVDQLCSIRGDFHSCTMRDWLSRAYFEITPSLPLRPLHMSVGLFRNRHSAAGFVYEAAHIAACMTLHVRLRSHDARKRALSRLHSNPCQRTERATGEAIATARGRRQVEPHHGGTRRAWRTGYETRRNRYSLLAP